MINTKAIKHLFKIIWHRKFKNFLMISEITISFVVLFAVMAVVVNQLYNYFSPTGYQYQQVWELSINAKNQERIDLAAALNGVDGLLKSYAEIDHFALAECYVFDPFVTSNGQYKIDGQTRIITNLRAGDELAKVLDFELVEGRWFQPVDQGAVIQPVVINRKLAKQITADGKSAVGRVFTNYNGSDKYKIVGVVSAYKAGGDLSKEEELLFGRFPAVGADSSLYKLINMSSFGTTYLIKVKAGQGNEFAEKMLGDLKGEGKDLSFSLQTLKEKRASAFKQVLIIPGILAAVSLFMLINIALGLFGVIWYNINRRKQEIAIRKALGAANRSIYLHIVGETVMLSTFGIAAGSLIALQFPLLGVIDYISNGIYLAAFVLSVICMYLLTIACSLYPARLAAHIEPAIALKND